jgi:hypothetical protein
MKKQKKFWISFKMILCGTLFILGIAITMHSLNQIEKYQLTIINLEISQSKVYQELMGAIMSNFEYQQITGEDLTIEIDSLFSQINNIPKSKDYKKLENAKKMFSKHFYLSFISILIGLIFLVQCKVQFNKLIKE